MGLLRGISKAAVGPGGAAGVAFWRLPALTAGDAECGAGRAANADRAARSAPMRNPATGATFSGFMGLIRGKSKTAFRPDVGAGSRCMGLLRGISKVVAVSGAADRR